MSAVPVSPPWRRCLRFSVRGLIVAVLLIGAGMGWIVRSADIQRTAVAAIRAAGGTVHYDWEWKNGSPFPLGKPKVPGWLVNQIGIDCFSDVVAVDLVNLRSTDAALAHVGRLSRLEHLCLLLTDVTKAGLFHLKGQKRLKVLGLGYTFAGDAGLVRLGELTSLQQLDLSGCDLTDDGLKHLKEMRSLRSLNLENNPRVSGIGLAYLKNLQSLTQLRFGSAGYKIARDENSPVNDAGIRDLKQALPNLSINR